MFKFCHVLFHEFHGLLPVSSGSKFSVVWIRLVNMNT
jgi:hypothetical protein